jgi:hypothetical protein
LGALLRRARALEKITTRCGPEAIAELNRQGGRGGGGAAGLRLEMVRADATMVAAKVAYPTDSGLLVRAIALLTTLVAVIHTGGGATRTTVRDRRRAAGRPARSISAHLKLRNDSPTAMADRLEAVSDRSALFTSAPTHALIKALRNLGVSQSPWLGQASVVVSVVTAEPGHRPFELVFVAPVRGEVEELIAAVDRIEAATVRGVGVEHLAGVADGEGADAGPSRVGGRGGRSCRCRRAVAGRE